MRWLLILLLLFCPLKSMAQDTFNLGAKQTLTIDDARRYAFEHLPRAPLMDKFPPVDPNLFLDLQARIHKQSEVNGNIITFFDEGPYYDVDMIGEDHTFEYNYSGQLTALSIKNRDNYPLIVASWYSYPSGKLLWITMRVNPYEVYKFDKDSHLISYAIGNDIYNANGTLVGHRKLYLDSLKH